MPLPRTTVIEDISEALVVDVHAVTSLFGQTINDVMPLLGGTAGQGCLVLISIGGAIFGVIANEAGEWSLDTGTEVPLSGRYDLGRDGRKKLVVIAIDFDGCSRAIHGEFTVSTARPQTPTLATVRVFRRWPLLDGHAEPDSRVAVTFGGATYVVTAGSNGAWTLDTASQQPLSGRFEMGADGRKHVTMVCNDFAGNTSAGSALLVLDTSTRMASLAVKALRPVPTGGAGRRVLSKLGHAWRAALDAGRGSMSPTGRN